MEEIRHALRVGGRNKAPGSDGIGWEFYIANWTTLKDDLCTVLNQLYTEKTIALQQKHGMVVCLPKNGGSQRPADFSPFTLLNVHYKLLAPIIAHMLRPLLGEQLQTTQFCGIPGNTIWTP
jgi:hypothetical protein